MSRKILQGIVVNAKSPKTLVVTVSRLKKHAKYKKRFIVTKRYKAHYENGTYVPGDKVLIESSRPFSKDKHWQVVGHVEKNKGRESLEQSESESPVDESSSIRTPTQSVESDI